MKKDYNATGLRKAIQTFAYQKDKSTKDCRTAGNSIPNIYECVQTRKEVWYGDSTGKIKYD
jgi:hypothetical protein